MRTLPLVLLGVLLVSLSLQLVAAGIIKQRLERDPRNRIAFDVFGFAAGGKLTIRASDIAFDPPKSTSAEDADAQLAGFLVVRVSSKVDALPGDPAVDCYLSPDVSIKGTRLLVKQGETATTEYVVDDDSEGYYAIYFLNCGAQQQFVTMNLEIVARNHDSDGGYLSVGQRNLPTIFLSMCGIQAFILAVWLITLMRNKAFVYKIHVVMSAVPALKVAFLFFEAMRLRQIEQEGSAPGWSVPFYIFAVLESTALFIVILLIGTGWSLTKPFLSDREKGIFKLILPLQLVADIAMIVTGELAPGSPSLAFWHNILRLVDIVCCCAVLFPIVWSIRQLKEAPRSKALRRLEAFRSFYVAVVVYIYFSRIVVVLLRAVLSVRNEYWGDVLNEAAAVLFYAFAGWTFRPYQENPYMSLTQSDDENEEGPETVGDAERAQSRTGFGHSEEGMD